MNHIAKLTEFFFKHAPEISIYNFFSYNFIFGFMEYID